jgi:ABC-type multidrug transport system fused ATPase/permease subunit
MKTEEEMDKEEDQMISDLRELAQKSYESFFNITKLNVLCFLILVSITFVIGSDILIAWTCIGAVACLSINMIVLGLAYLDEKRSLIQLKNMMRQARRIESMHQLIIDFGKASIEKRK